MTRAVSEAPRDPAWRTRATLLVLAVAVLWPLLTAAEFHPATLFDRQSLAASWRFLSGFFPPAHSPEFLRLVAEAAWQTIAIASAGMALALSGAIPLCLATNAQLSLSAIGAPMSAPAALARQALRWLALVLRSVPELVWALLFVRIVGLGPSAAVLAIALTYCGMLAKVYSEILESAERHASNALLRNGSGRLAAFLYGTLPQAADELLSYTVYRWECAIRGSVIMGFVGAGGLGQRIDESLKMLAGAEVSTILLCFVALVAAADAASTWVRRRLSAPAGHGALLASVALVAASFASLDLRWAELFSPAALTAGLEFLHGFFPPALSPTLLKAIAQATLETLAMSALGTAFAALAGLLLALPAAGRFGLAARLGTRALLNLLRAIPELVWAALLLIAAGLGPFAGTLALAAHTTGVLGRLFADTLENTGHSSESALRINGAGAIGAFLYAALPQALPSLLSYTLYRWENNIRAAAVLGVVGAGGLGQMLKFHLALFHMPNAASIILAMLALVALVDAASYASRRWLMR